MSASPHDEDWRCVDVIATSGYPRFLSAERILARAKRTRPVWIWATAKLSDRPARRALSPNGLIVISMHSEDAFRSALITVARSFSVDVPRKIGALAAIELSDRLSERSRAIIIVCKLSTPALRTATCPVIISIRKRRSISAMKSPITGLSGSSYPCRTCICCRMQWSKPSTCM